MSVTGWDIIDFMYLIVPKSLAFLGASPLHENVTNEMSYVFSTPMNIRE